MSVTREDVQLTTAAIGYAETVRCLKLDPPDTASGESLRGALDHLETTALAFAAARGQLDAGERAELHALRHFRDGVAALRGELAECGHVAETLDAFFALSHPDVRPPGFRLGCAVVGEDGVPIAGHPALFMDGAE